VATLTQSEKLKCTCAGSPRIAVNDGRSVYAGRHSSWADRIGLGRGGSRGVAPRDQAEPRSRLMTATFPSDVGHGAMRTRLESPRVCYATPGVRIAATRAL